MRPIPVLLLLASLALAGCASEGDDAGPEADPTSSMTTTTPPPMAPPPVTHESVMRNNLFVPADLTVRVGDTVHWITEDVQAHNVVSESEAATFRSEDVSVAPVVGTSTEFSYTFTMAGEVDYVCEYHPGMVGTVTVQNQTA